MERISARTMSSLENLKNIKIEYDGQIAVVQLNQADSKVNTLSKGMMEEFIPVFNHLKDDSQIRGIVVISSKPGSFIAGADINMLESAQSREELYRMSRDGQEITNELEQSPKPIVAAIAGSCLGGGFEVALACHYRIALDDQRTVFGVPEVKLGLLPGAGGTQRLLQHLSLTDALGVLLTGREMKAKKAKTMGLVDTLVESVGSDLQNIEHLRSIAIDKAKELARQKSFKRQSGLYQTIRSQITRNSFIRNYILSQAQAKVIAQTRGLYPAPLRILDVIKQTLEKGAKVGFNAEAEAFADLGMTNESKALIGLFHGRTECKKNRFGKPDREVKTMAIIGADVIGAGIAGVSLNKDFRVILYDTTVHAVTRGQSQIHRNYAQRTGIMSNLSCQTTFTNLDTCHLIIESVFEDLSLKENVLEKLEQHIPEHCIYASNTYTIPLERLAAHSQRPGQIIGMHYSSPVEKVELLEIIRTKQTSNQTICSAVHVGLQQGKLIIVINDGPGFYTTRLLVFSSIEIFYFLQEGLSATEIDRATKQFGFHVGLATMVDEFGIDMLTFITLELRKTFGDRLVNASVMELLQMCIRKNFLGRKSNQGLFVYQTNGKKETNARLRELTSDSSTPTKKVSTTDDIQWRVALRIINEAARCLEENIINSPSDGDIGAVFGLGFPPMKGGPFRFMDTYGLSNILDLMNNYQSQYGDRFVPAQILIDMANANKKFYS